MAYQLDEDQKPKAIVALSSLFPFLESAAGNENKKQQSMQRMDQILAEKQTFIFQRVPREIKKVCQLSLPTGNISSAASRVDIITSVTDREDRVDERDYLRHFGVTVEDGKLFIVNYAKPSTRPLLKVLSGKS